MKRLLVLLSALGLACASTRVSPPAHEASRAQEAYDVLIRNGTIYDGSGAAPFVGDLAIRGDTIAAIAPAGDPGALRGASARLEIDARGQAVAPGFVNMLSWATESLLV